MPLNKAPSGALLFGGDMRLLLFIFLLFSFSSYSQTTVQKFKKCEVVPNTSLISSLGIKAVSYSDLTRDECVKSAESAIVTGEFKYGSQTWGGKQMYAEYDGGGWRTSSPYEYRVRFNFYVYGDTGKRTLVSSGAAETLLLSEPYDAPVEPKPCETPKTDDQCNKGKTATITGNDVFWATGNYKGCTFTAADGVFIKLADGTMTGDATSTGSTGKSWCETTDSSYNPADDEALSKNPAFSPAKDNDPKNCKNGWVQAGGGKFHCLNDTSGNVDAPPDKVNPEDGSINSDKDGKPKPPDAGVGKPPTGGTDPDGGGGTDGGGDGECEGENCEGGGGTKPPARPADPWADILDAADVARVKADTQSVQDELADFYRSAASGFQININKPAAGSMPSFGDVSVGGDKVSLSLDWLDKISFIDARAGVLVLCSLWAAYIILVRR